MLRWYTRRCWVVGLVERHMLAQLLETTARNGLPMLRRVCVPQARVSAGCSRGIGNTRWPSPWRHTCC